MMYPFYVNYSDTSLPARQEARQRLKRSIACVGSTDPAFKFAYCHYSPPLSNISN